VTVWGENFHENSERDRDMMARLYPEGMHGAIAAGLTELLGDHVEVRTATQDQPEHGLSAEVLDNTDVLTWWGHATHAGVDDAGATTGCSAGWVCCPSTPRTSPRSSSS
jgi:trehalose utilization protein